MISPSLVVRSITISAPVLSSDISQTASVSEVIIASVCELSPDFDSPIERRLLNGSAPTFSSAERSSGWNTIITAITPT